MLSGAVRDHLSDGTVHRAALAGTCLAQIELGGGVVPVSFSFKAVKADVNLPLGYDDAAPLRVAWGGGQNSDSPIEWGAAGDVGRT